MSEHDHPRARHRSAIRPLRVAAGSSLFFDKAMEATLHSELANRQMLGYRYLDVDYKNGGFLYNTHMSGALAGFAIHFK